MGVDTKALLRGHIELSDLAKTIIDIFGCEDITKMIRQTNDPDYYRFQFYSRPVPDFNHMDRDEAVEWVYLYSRSMSVFLNGSCSGDYAHITTDPHTYVSLGFFGDSVDIMEALLKRYGGYLMTNDFDGNWEEYSE